MPFSVLRLSKTNDGDVEVLGEFTEEQEAIAFVEASQANEEDPDYEYSIETPPSLA